MSENVDKTEHIEIVSSSDRELAYQKLCEFEKNYCESIYQKANGSVVYKIEPSLLAELENVKESDLKELDFSTVEYPSYERLFESRYKEKFLKNVAAISSKQLEKKLGRETLVQAINNDKELKFPVNLKEVDLDNDGVPDRIDIDDSRNSVQTVADLNIIKNSTSKDTNRDIEKEKEKQKNNMEL
ncbi:hypothetical protein ACIQZG_21980 [Lysinibacillus sp. NPDC096418]|uniref:hypothetical protein n=1 Tax=Lysinibacillus sp. NPDC096418 TaxID=3364138 RepID=UPI0038231C6C